MTDIHAGDLVMAVPIGDCAIGHPAWHGDFDHPDMTRRAYIVTWAGYSAYWHRPVIAVAGRRGRYCAGCFARRQSAQPLRRERVARHLARAA